MSLHYALLGMLASKPGTGYELTQRFDQSLRNAWHASHSQIYPELARLDEAGLIEVVEEGQRNSRTWGITAAGREDLRRWMTETETDRRVRNETALRYFLFGLLEPADRRVALERERKHLEEADEEFRTVAAHLEALDGPTPFRPVVDLGQRLNAVFSAWVDERLADADEPPAS